MVRRGLSQEQVKAPLSRAVSPDVRLLFVTRVTRLFAYGVLSVVLVLYLAELGLSDARIGILLTLTLIGDTAVSLWLTTRADRIGRRRMLIVGAVLMVLAGLTFALTRNHLFLVIAATIGVISPSGNEVGPFLPIEQAALSQIVPGGRRTQVFAWYTLAGSFATAAGSLVGGVLVQTLQQTRMTPLNSYRAAVLIYGILGLVMAGLFTRLSVATEAESRGVASEPSTPSSRLFFGLNRSRGVVLKLSALFSLDAFAGGFVIQSIAAYWFHLRFASTPATLGAIFFGANILAGLSSLLAARVAARIGLINTMVFTHLPSNLLLILVPLMPNVTLATLVLFLRFSISQMDVPTRQSYTMAVVSPDERSAAAGVTGVARTTGAALSPMIAGVLLGHGALINVPFFLAGSLKILYDLLLYRKFIRLRPPEERPR